MIPSSKIIVPEVDDYDTSNSDSADYATSNSNAGQEADYDTSNADTEQEADYDAQVSPKQIRERVLEKITDEANRRIAFITRSSYGSLVMNTERVMFLDVDDPHATRESQEAEVRRSGRATSRDTWQKSVLTKARTWARQHRGWAWRIYRTHSGMRLLATHDVFDPSHAMTSGIVEAVGVDPHYRRLCEVQKCFRARLTPKPWRCGSTRAPERSPGDAAAARRLRTWNKTYEALCHDWATCALIATIGAAPIHPEVNRVIGVHDAATRVDSLLPLA